MGRGHGDPLTTSAIINAAIPRNTAKVLTRALGCTDRQGRRIATGKVPSRFREALIRLLDTEIARNKKILMEADNALREIERGASSLGTDARMASGFDSRR